MRIITSIWVLLMVGVFIGTVSIPIAYAADEEILKELQELKARIEQLEKRLAEQDNQIEMQTKRIGEHTEQLAEVKYVKSALGNLEIYVGATGVIQGTINNDSNYRRSPGLPRDGDVTDGNYSVDLEISSPIGENGRALLYLQAGEGMNVVDEAGGFTGANADAIGDDGDVEVSEVWYEHKLFKNRAVLTVGKLDATRFFDNNVVANDETTQFLADIFANSIAMDWPDYAAGMRFSLYPTHWLDINLGLIEADSDWEDLFDDNFSIVEFNYKPLIGTLPGNYRFYYWWNSSEHERLRHPRDANEEGEGFGLSFDQALSENITAFARFGIQDSNIYEIKRSWSLGAQISGAIWRRPDDMFGLAYGQAELGDEFEDLLRDDRFDPEDEGRFEAYYLYRINDHLAISPDLQIAHDLGGSSGSETFTILGVRAQLDF